MKPPKPPHGNLHCTKWGTLIESGGTWWFLEILQGPPQWIGVISKAAACKLLKQRLPHARLIAENYFAAAPDLFDSLQECADLLEEQYRIALGQNLGVRRNKAVDAEVARHVVLVRARAALERAAKVLSSEGEVP